MLPERYRHLSQYLIKERKKPERKVSDAGNPMDEYDNYWLFAYKKRGRKRYVDEQASGKWLVFVHKDQVNEAWGKIRKATEDGLLGDKSKCTMAKENPNALNSDEKVICVYTNN